MEVKFTDSSRVNSLEEYLRGLLMGLVSVKTLSNHHKSAIREGILTDDMITRAKVIMFDLLRAEEQYNVLLHDVLELLPTDFSIEKLIAEIQSEAQKNES